MRNVTPGIRFSVLGFVAGIVFILVGGWLLWSDRALLFQFLKLFAGIFLLLFGLGVFGASFRRS